MLDPYVMLCMLKRSSFGCARLLESPIMVENMYCFLLQDIRLSSLYELILGVDLGPRSIFLTIIRFSLRVMFTINFLLLLCVQSFIGISSAQCLRHPRVK
uniref:Putative ovule protein n=1 Tax=Solanum chacoense TaxID=4108 RepID=A0A0V0I2V4_SOLCH